MAFFGRSPTRLISRPTRAHFRRSPRTVIQCLVFFSIVLLLQGCNISGKEEQSKAISIGSTRVGLAEVKSEFKELIKALPVTDENRKRVVKQVLEQIVERHLILEYWKEQGISFSEAELNASIKTIRGDYTDEGFREAVLREYIDFDLWKRQLRKRLLVEKILKKVGGQAPLPGHADIVRYYEQHADSFHSERQIEFRQIVTSEKQQAKIALEKLRKGSDFGKLATEISIAPEASRGGMVGWVTQGQLEKSMDKALFALKPGQLSSVIHSPYGYHIFEVLETQPARTKTLPEVTKEIASKLFRQRRGVFLTHWLEGLKNRFEVYVNPNLSDLLES
jgi:peptidyl-prolyl cis-trans isomerase C